MTTHSGPEIPIVAAPIVAVFFDFAGTLFDDRDLRDIHLQQLRFVAAAAGIDAADDPLRSAYRQGMMGVVRPDAMIHSLAEVLGIVGPDVSLRASR